MDFSIFIVSGLMVVLGAVWAIVYNADVLLAAVGAAPAGFGRWRRSATNGGRLSAPEPLPHGRHTGDVRSSCSRW